MYTYWKVRVAQGYEYRKEIIPEDPYQVLDTVISSDGETPDLVASRCTDGLHRLAIDIDFPVRLIPSRTEGHFHLYMDGMTPINFHRYVDLLRSLAKAGVIEHNYAEVSIRRGMTMLRYSKDTLLPTDKDFGFLLGKSDSWALLNDPLINDGSTDREPQTQIIEPLARRVGGFVRSIIRHRGIYG